MRTGRRPAALDPLAMQAPRPQWRRQANHRDLLGGGYPDFDLVFPNPDGSSLNPDNVTRVLFRWPDRAGLKRIRLHDGQSPVSV